VFAFVLDKNSGLFELKFISEFWPFCRRICYKHPKISRRTKLHQETQSKLFLTFHSRLRKAIPVYYIWWLSLPSLTRWRRIIELDLRFQSARPWMILSKEAGV
jgi:hypothetical protein